MQQLNVLPINVSQNIDSKDDSSALISSSSSDDFSQHIDLHLAKNKDVANSKNGVNEEKTAGNNSDVVDESTDLKAELNSQQTSAKSDKNSDEQSAATEEPAIAASGNKAEVEQGETVKDEFLNTLDESAQLISFLAKSDKTLVDVSLLEKAQLNGISEQDKSQLLSKPEGLATDLSKVAKAISENSTAEFEALSEKGDKIGIQDLSKKEGTSKSDHAYIQNKSIIASENDDKHNESLEKNTDELEGKLIQNRTDTAVSSGIKFDEKNHGDSLNKKLSDLALQQQSPNKSGKESELTSAQMSQLHQSKNNDSSEVIETQLANETKSGVENNQNTPVGKASSQTQSSTINQSLFEQDSTIDEQIAKLIESEKGSTKLETNTVSAATTLQGKNKPLPNESLKQSIAETLAKENIKAEMESESQSTDNLIDKHKEINVTAAKEEQGKGLPKTTSGFALNSTLIDSTQRVSQSNVDRIDQQTVDMLNPTSSTEVTQSQKTNAQLHQETISIFRKDFSDAVKDKVMLMISQKLQQFDITLDPPELGNMQVRVNLQGEQASVNFIVQNQQAKDALEQNMHKLKELLAEQGVDVGDANVEQQSQQTEEEGNQENQQTAKTNIAEADDVIEHTLSANMIDSATRGVDYYA